MDLLGFWSYVHADDEVDMGRVTQLAKDIVAHYEAIQAESIRLFLDRDDLHWGDQWREEVDDALSNVAFFIPVITPRYFKRVECRRELQFFAERTERLGITELILPILYIDVPELREDEPSDPLMRLVKTIQWEPWLDFRFKDRESGAYQAAVNALAQELVRRVGTVERKDVVSAARQAEASISSEEGEAGTLDRIAALEEAMPRWVATMDSIREEIDRIGEIMQRGTRDVSAGENQGKGFAARLNVARRVSGELEEPVSKIEGLGREFVSDLYEIDAGVRELLSHAEDSVNANPETKGDVCEFLGALRGLSVSSAEGLGSVAAMIEASKGLEGMSKDMRKPLRQLRNSLTSMLEAREVTNSWVAVVDGLNIDCGGDGA